MSAWNDFTHGRLSFESDTTQMSIGIARIFARASTQNWSIGFASAASTQPPYDVWWMPDSCKLACHLAPGTLRTNARTAFWWANVPVEPAVPSLRLAATP